MKTSFPLAFTLLTILFAQGQWVLSASDRPTQPPKPADPLLVFPDSSIIHFDADSAKDESVRSVAFSPKGKLIAVGNAQGRVKVFDAFSGRAILTFNPDGWSEAVAFSPDGKTLVAPVDSVDWGLFDLLTGRLVRRISPPQAVEDAECRTAVAFSPDSKLLAGSYYGGHVCLWDAASGRLLRDLPPFIMPPLKKPPLFPGGSFFDRTPTPAVVRGLAFSPDSKTLYVAGYAIRAWDVSGKAEPRLLKIPENRTCGAFALAPDGATLAAAVGPDEEGHESIILLDAASGQKRAEWTLDEEIQSLVFLNGSRKLVSLDGNKTLRLWDAALEKPILARHFKEGYHFLVLAVSSDGLRVAAGGLFGDTSGVIGLVETDATSLSPWAPKP